MHDSRYATELITLQYLIKNIMSFGHRKNKENVVFSQLLPKES